MQIDVHCNFRDAMADKDDDSYDRNTDYFLGVATRIHNEVVTYHGRDIEYNLDSLLDWKHFMYCTAHINRSACR